MIQTIQWITILLVVIFFNHDTVAQETGAKKEAGESWQPHNLPVSYGGDTIPPTPVISSGDHENWWEILGYDQLNALIALALTENHQLAGIQRQVRESEAKVRLAKSAFYPAVGVNPSVYRQELSANTPLTGSTVGQIRYNTYTLPVDLSYEVDVFGKIKNEVKTSQFNLKASAASEEVARLEVGSAIAKNFVLLLTLDSEYKVLNRTLEARKENLEIVTVRYDAGLTNEIDVQRAHTEMSSVNVRIKNILIDRRNTEARLATLSGQPVADFSVESEGIQYLAPVVNPDGLSMQVLDRPDLQVANYVVEAYRKQIKTARKQRYPSLFVSGSLGLLSGNSDDLFEDESRNWLLGASLSIPLFEGGRRQALLDISEYQLENAAEQLSQNELVANQEVTQATAELQRLNEQLFNQQEFLAAADCTAALSRQRYKQGLVTYLEVVDADRIVLEAERLLVQLLGQQLLTTVDLLTALGGDMNQIK